MTLIIGNFEPSTSVSDAEPSTAQCIGAILTMIDGLRSKVAFYCYDANGNVTDLMGTNGSFLAQYQFDPYGNTISKTGALADVNPFRFSTKYLDSETGLYYYGHRYYMPEVGRWGSRDPIYDAAFTVVAENAEIVDQVDIHAEVDINEYAFISQSPVTLIDRLGLLQIGAPIPCGNCLICIDRDTSGGSGGTIHIHWNCGRRRPSSCRGNGSADWPSGRGREGSGDAPTNIRRCLKDSKWKFDPVAIPVPAPNFCCNRQTVTQLAVATGGACILTYLYYKTVKTCTGATVGFFVAGPPGALGGAAVCLLTP
jgi:RHS repeat-associated protein